MDIIYIRGISTDQTRAGGANAIEFLASAHQESVQQHTVNLTVTLTFVFFGNATSLVLITATSPTFETSTSPAFVTATSPALVTATSPVFITATSPALVTDTSPVFITVTSPEDANASACLYRSKSTKQS